LIAHPNGGPTIALVTNTDRFAFVNHGSRIRALQERGHRVVVLTDVGEYRDQLFSMGIEVHHVPIARHIAPIDDLHSLWCCFRALRSIQPDIVHTHTSKAGVLGRIAGRLAGVPVVVHTLQGLPFYEGQPRARSILYASLEWIAGQFGHAVFSESREDLAQARSLRLGRRDRLFHIGSGIRFQDIERQMQTEARSTLKDQLQIHNDAVVLLFPARLEPVKGHSFFLDVMQDLGTRSKSPFVCLCAGDGPLRSELETRAHDLGLASSIRFLGFRDDLPALLRVADILVLPSEKEGIARVLLEAMAARIPIVATDVTGTREVVVSGVTGLLSPFGATHSMARNLAYLIERPEARARFGRAGRERVRRVFDERKVPERIDGLYRILLNLNPSKALGENR